MWASSYNNSLHANASHASSQLTDRWAGQQTREYIDWLWPLSCVHSFSHDGIFGPAWVRVVGPPPFHSPSIRVTSPLQGPSAPFPAKLARAYYLYSPLLHLPSFSEQNFLCFLKQTKKLCSISCSENDAGLVINGTGEGRDEKQTNEEEKRGGSNRNTSDEKSWKCRPENVERGEGKWKRKRKQRLSSLTPFLVEVLGHKLESF